jgi:hypothetical protein
MAGKNYHDVTLTADDKKYAVVDVWNPQYDARNGEPVSQPHTQKYSKREWDMFLATNIGYRVTHIHNIPKGFQEPPAAMRASFKGIIKGESDRAAELAKENAATSKQAEKGKR